MPHPTDLNRAWWNAATPLHLRSAFYGQDAFLAGANSLREIELEHLGEVAGRRILHLQCHFGQDTLSLARMGAQVTGVDFSDAAIEAARSMTVSLGLKAAFIQADVTQLPRQWPAPFDLVYTSYGALVWLPELHGWAEGIAAALRPGGELLIVEFHPMMMVYDDSYAHPVYSYFNREPIGEVTSSSYADRQTPLEQEIVTYNHPFSELLDALTGAGLVFSALAEYDYSPWECFTRLVPAGPGRWQIEGMEGKLPMVFALRMKKPG